MALPTLAGTGRLLADPELRFSASGTAVCSMRLAFNSRRKTADGWEDGDQLFVEAVAFRGLAEQVAESLSRGHEVNVIGRLKTESWEDRATGEKRSKVSLLVDAIGPNLRYATATVRKADRGGGGSGAGEDPWGSAPPAAGRSAGLNDEPPFHHHPSLNEVTW